MTMSVLLLLSAYVLAFFGLVNADTEIVNFHAHDVQTALDADTARVDARSMCVHHA